MKHVVKHNLSPELAKKATEKAWASYSERFAKYEPTSNWTSETHSDVSFTVKGVTLNGSLDLEPGGVALDLDVPFIFKPFKNKAMGVVEEEIKDWVKKAEAGELD